MSNVKCQISKLSRNIIVLFLAFGFCHLILFSQNKLDVIIIDAGHGGKDPGTIGDFTGVQEKNIVMPIAVKLGKMIEEKFPAMRVIFTRVTDDFVELKERTRIANQNKGKLFISIHANHKKMEETEKNGFEVYLLNRERIPEAIQFTMKENFNLIFRQVGGDTTDNFIFATLAQSGYTKFNDFLASMIEINMLNLTDLASRGVFQAGNWVTLGASMPSVLVETGYLSDSNNEKYLSSEKGQNDIAIALFNAFLSFKVLYETQ